MIFEPQRVIQFDKDGLVENFISRIEPDEFKNIDYQVYANYELCLETFTSFSSPNCFTSKHIRQLSLDFIQNLIDQKIYLAPCDYNLKFAVELVFHNRLEESISTPMLKISYDFSNQLKVNFVDVYESMYFSILSLYHSKQTTDVQELSKLIQYDLGMFLWEISIHSSEAKFQQYQHLLIEKYVNS